MGKYFKILSEICDKKELFKTKKRGRGGGQMFDSKPS